MFSSTKRLIETLEKQITDERAMHAAELHRALSENKRLQDEIERLRLTAGQPSRMAEPPETPKPQADPDEMPAFTGTPWERVQQREMWFRTPSGKRWQAKQVASLREISGETEKAKEIH